MLKLRQVRKEYKESLRLELASNIMTYVYCSLNTVVQALDPAIFLTSKPWDKIYH